MKTRKLGNLEVSAIGFGCMGMSHAAGAPMSIEDGAEVLRAAVDAGYTYFDTAKNYGNVNDPCHNEKILGRAFAGIRDKVIIGSKTGVEFDYAVDPDMPPLLYDSSRESVRRSVEGSLKRLGTDYIDLYFQARIDPKVEPEEVAQTMAELIKEGKILHWGISEVNLEYLKRAHAVCPVTAVENNYSIINRAHEDIIPFLEENNIGWVAQGTLVKGLLTGAYKKGATYARDDWRGRSLSDENLDKYAPLLAYLAELGQQKGATPGQLSLAWVMSRKPYIVPIPGTTKKERLVENAGAADVSLSENEMAEIEGIVREISEV